MDDKTLKVALAQVSPILLKPQETLVKVLKRCQEAADQNCELICFSEALLPGYPFWLAYTNSGRFNSQVQKDIHAQYLDSALVVEKGDLDLLKNTAARFKMAIYIGIMERPLDRGGHSLYCSLVYINPEGDIQSVHRKLMPTYEERLSWAAGDGHGLQVHALKGFRLGGLSCWENWMPLARTALYSQGENIHVATWPGMERNTKGISPFIAQESRSYVLSVCGYLHRNDIPKDFPHYELFYENAPEVLADGGTGIASPDGSWLLEPQVGKEGLFVRELSLLKVYEERQNFDPSGHYSRPDVFELKVNRKRQASSTF
jgi:nitrilase